MSHLTAHQQLNRSRQWSATQNYPETGLWEVKEMFPVRLGIVRQLRVPFVCRTSSGSMGASDRTSRLTVAQPSAGLLRWVPRCKQAKMRGVATRRKSTVALVSERIDQSALQVSCGEFLSLVDPE